MKKLLFVILVGLLVAGLVPGDPGDEAHQWPNVSIEEHFKSPATDRDTYAGGLGFVAMIITGIVFSLRDREFGYMLGVILGLIIIAVLLYGLVTVVIPISLHGVP